MQTLSKIVTTAVISATIGGLFAFFIADRGNANMKDKTEDLKYLTYYDSISGITFDYNSDWIVEKHNTNSGEWFIDAHAPLDMEWLKTVRISLSSEQDIDIAVKRWWIENGDKLNIDENMLHFQYPRTHRYQGITYAANRAQIKYVTGSASYPIDYRVMAVSIKGQTILLVERAERGGMDGFEADGLIRIEKTLNIIGK